MNDLLTYTQGDAKLYTLKEGAGMRTNLVIDDELMAKAMKASKEKTKRAVVEEALRFIVQIRAQEGILKLGRKLKWEGNLDESRLSRDFDR